MDMMQKKHDCDHLHIHYRMSHEDKALQVVTKTRHRNRTKKKTHMQMNLRFAFFFPLQHFHATDFMCKMVTYLYCMLFSVLFQSSIMIRDHRRSAYQQTKGNNLQCLAEY